MRSTTELDGLAGQPGIELRQGRVALPPHSGIYFDKPRVNTLRLPRSLAGCERKSGQKLALRVRKPALHGEALRKLFPRVGIVRVLPGDDAPERRFAHGVGGGVGELRDRVGGDLVDIGVRMVLAEVPFPGSGAEGDRPVHNGPIAFDGARVVLAPPVDIGEQVASIAEPWRGLAGPVEEVQRALRSEEHTSE